MQKNLKKKLSWVSTARRVVPPVKSVKKSKVSITKLGQVLGNISKEKDVQEISNLVNGLLDDVKGYYNSKEAVVRLNPDIPTIIIPDIHARREELLKVLMRKDYGKPNIESLAEGKIQIVQLGDLMHSEKRPIWTAISKEFEKTGFKGNTPKMD